MSKFPSWFTSAYDRWKKSQPGEEDFPAFCDLLGYPATKVMNWLEGETEPQGSELLNIAGICGTEIYSVLDQPEPDPELLTFFQSFPHFSGEDRSKLAETLWEAEKEMKVKGISASSADAGGILSAAFTKWGIAPNPK
jgi:hypothetical protein